MGAGVVSEGWSKHLKAIEATLMDIEKLHQQHLGSGAMAARDQFYAKRSALFMKLDEQLNKLAAYGSGLRNKSSIKRTLGISTKSYLHTGEIAGYANKVSGVAKAAKLIKKGTYVGVSLEVAATGLEIHKACTLGREEECKKAQYVEISSLALGLGGTAAGAAGGKLLLGAACSVVFGVASGGMGALACGIFGGTAGGMAGGKLGSEIGAKAGELLYEAVIK